MASITAHLSLFPHFPNSKLYPSCLSSRSISSTVKILSCSATFQENGEIFTARNDTMDNLRVVFAASDTGGHIFPAVAIADELKISNPNTEILFIGSPDSMESSSIASAGYKFESFPAVRLANSLISLENLLLPYRLIKALIRCNEILRGFSPHVVVGTGGYVSFPTCVLALLRRSKLVIQEQNCVPGFCNWVLSVLADVVFVAYNSSVDCFPMKNKCVVCGNPVRMSLRKYVSQAVARMHFFGRAGDKDTKVVLILGGSFRANALNIAMLNLYYQMLLENDNLFIIWQTGIQGFDEMESLVKRHRNLLLTPFMHSMDLAYAAADLVVSRAGAMTCYEILATGKPSILIPSPHTMEGHQFKNAALMADLAGSIVITEDELDSTTLAIAIDEILGNEGKIEEMSERASKAAKPDAAAEIARHILSFVNSESRIETKSLDE